MSPGPTDTSLTPFPELPLAAGAMRGAADYLDEEGGGVDVRRYLSVLLRHKWMILALSALGLAGGVYVSRLVKPAYVTQATIQIDIVNRNAVQSSPIRETQLLEARGWLDLLKSFRVLDEVVSRRRLFVEYSDPTESRFFEQFEVGAAFKPGLYRLTVSGDGARASFATAEGTVLEERALGDSIGGSVGFHWVPKDLPPGRVLTFLVRTPRDAAVRLSDALDAPALSPDGSFLRISLRGTDPVAITATINAVAERFVEVAAFLKRDKLSQVTEVLRAQLERTSTDLRNAENALETFKVSTITLPSDRYATPIASGLAETQDPVRQAFFKLRFELDSLEQDRDAIERGLRVKPDSINSLVVILGSVSSVRSSAEISASLALLGSKRAEARAMRLAFGPAHQPLQELERDIRELETVTVPIQARAVVANIEQGIRDVKRRLDASAEEMQQIPARVSEEARRERNVVIANNLYTQLQAAFEGARLAELSAAPDVRILDDAKVPTQPVTDQLLIIIAGGLAGGLGLGVLLSILLDRFDKRIRYPDQVTQGLGLQILGALPVMSNGKNGKARPEQAANLLEALRTIRMNLGYAHGTAGTFITTITSPGAGDGKSFLSANLAKIFASSGRRTLLIDADTRRGVQHRTMGVTRKPGLLDYLTGTASREQIIRSIPDMGIDFIPCGTRMSGGTELLASSQMAQLIMGLRGEYQAIIIDSPPIGAGVDPLVLASLTGSLVMVLRTGVTDREFAESRLHDLHRLPIRVLGAVLNDVKAEGIYRYYSYLPGYRSEDEVEPEESPKLIKGGR